MKNILLIHYSEIGLKGKNRGYFERKLRNDIQSRLCPAQASQVRIESSRLMAELHDTFDQNAVHAALNQVFGVAWYAFAQCIERHENALLQACLQAVKDNPSAKTFKIFCKRIDKSFPMTSQEICIRMGRAVEEQHKLKVDLDHHDLAVCLEILSDKVCLYTQKHPGLRGLPRASSGRMLCLFSGGIDSPVAAWTLMRRGAVVNLVHFHPYRKAEELKESKIIRQYKVLLNFNPQSKLYLIPHYHFQVEAGLTIPTSFEMVVFRRFMLLTSEKLAMRHHMKALITGDSLGQVASQTLDNMAAAQAGLTIPLFQPLIASDKEDIIRLAQKINTYELSNLPYKDCCSLIARRPKTCVSAEKMARLEQSIDMEKIIEESIKSAEIYSLRS